MKPFPIDKLVYEHMFPRPKPTDPQNFQTFLQRSLIPEVRQETHAFYGHLETQEARYPGLDYAHPTHRIRLSRWPWHQRLLRAFDDLQLTKAEIAHLTRWEGTKWAKDKYEREHCVIIRDTTADSFPTWVEPPDVRTSISRRSRRSAAAPDGIASTALLSAASVSPLLTPCDEPEGDAEVPSLAEPAASSAVSNEALCDEFDQWLKNAIESGHEFAPTGDARLAGAVIPLQFFPDSAVSSARASDWSSVPSNFHGPLRRALEAERRAAQDTDPETIYLREAQRMRMTWAMIDDVEQSSARLPSNATST